MDASISTVMVVVALAAGLWWGFARAAPPGPAGAVLDRRAGAGGCHARGRGPALAARSVAGSRCRGRGCRRVSALAAGSFAPLAESDRARHAGRRAGARRAGAPDGVGAGAAEAIGPAQRRQRGLPLDGRQALRDVHRRPVGPPSGHRSGVVPDRCDDGSGSSVLRGARPSAVVDRRASVLHVRAPSVASRRTRPPRPRSVPRSGRGRWCSSRRGCRCRARQYTALCADLASRGLRGRGPQRPLRVSGLGPGGWQGRRSDDASGCDGAAAASRARAPDRHPRGRQPVRARPARVSWRSSSRVRRWPGTSICSTSGSSVTRSAARPPFRSWPATRGSRSASTSTASSSGREPDARLDRPFLWIQSGGAQDRRSTRTGATGSSLASSDDGTQLTIRGSMHMSFSDDPSYLTSLGRA